MDLELIPYLVYYVLYGRNKCFSAYKTFLATLDVGHTGVPAQHATYLYPTRYPTRGFHAYADQNYPGSIDDFAYHPGRLFVWEESRVRGLE